MGRTALIMVLGFFIIFGLISFNISKQVTRAIGNMVGYHETQISRNIARLGANVGLAIFRDNPNSPPGTLVTRNFTNGNFAGGSFTVTLHDIPKKGNVAGYTILRSVGRYPTFLKDMFGNSVFLEDTVEVRLQQRINFNFARYTYFLDRMAGRQPFYMDDIIRGKVHINSDMYLMPNVYPYIPGKKPIVFTSTSSMPSEVTVAGKIRFHNGVTDNSYWRGPNKNDECYLNEPPTKKNSTSPYDYTWADFFKGTYKTSADGIGRIEFPSDLTSITSNLSNSSTRDRDILVELHAGGTGGGADNTDGNGKAIIKNKVTGEVLETINLSGTGNTVIYSSDTVRVKGTLDGRLTIASGKSIKIEGNVQYEKAPDCNKSFSEAIKETNDMLGLVAEKDILISWDYNPTAPLTIHAAMFCKNGGFGREGILTDSRMPTSVSLTLLGSIVQKKQGFLRNDGWNEDMTQYNSACANRGYTKSYTYDVRMNPPDNVPNPENYFPPFYPSYTIPGEFAINSWYESRRKPLILDEYVY